MIQIFKTNNNYKLKIVFKYNLDIFEESFIRNNNK